MFKILLLRFLPLTAILFILLILSSFIHEKYNDKEPKPGVDPNIIKIDKLTIKRYEQAGLLWPELESAYFTLPAQLLIHEFSHYGANLSQTIDYTDGEASTPNHGPYTYRFDLAAFGYPNTDPEVMRYNCLCTAK